VGEAERLLREEEERLRREEENLRRQETELLRSLSTRSPPGRGAQASAISPVVPAAASRGRESSVAAGGVDRGSFQASLAQKLALGRAVHHQSSAVSPAASPMKFFTIDPHGSLSLSVFRVLRDLIIAPIPCLSHSLSLSLVTPHQISRIDTEPARLPCHDCQQRCADLVDANLLR
jgi:hypothetical protein